MSETVAYPKVRVRYLGPPGSHSVIGLATRTKYGRHEYGDVFWVHLADAEADPEAYAILDDSEGESIADGLPKTPDGLRLPDVEQLVSGAGQEPPADAPSLPEMSPIGDKPEPSSDVVDDAAAEPQAAAAQAPPEIATLVDIGISEEDSSRVAQVGLFTVADVVAYIQANGEDALKGIDGVSRKTAKLIVSQMKAYGYLPGDDAAAEPQAAAE